MTTSRRRKRPARPATPADRRKVECWCGAKPLQPCLNHKGEPALTQHNTRGMPRKTVVAIAKAAGLPWPR